MMKRKSKILKILNEVSNGNVVNYYRLETEDLLVVDCKEITWDTISKLGKEIVNIKGCEFSRNIIRISFDNVIFD